MSSDDENANIKFAQQPPTSLIDQVAKDLAKSDLEGVKAKAKELVKKRREHEKAIRQLDVELSKLVEDHEKGIL